MNRSFVSTRLVVCVAVLLWAVPAASQSFYGSVLGAIKDAQGGIVPGATVVLTNVATSERREGVSADDGTFRFVNLVPGTYRLEVELTGFQRFVRDGIEVNVQAMPRVDVTLQLGNLAETLTVIGESPLLQTQSASVGTIVGNRAVRELPARTCLLPATTRSAVASPTRALLSMMESLCRTRRTATSSC